MYFLPGYKNLAKPVENLSYLLWVNSRCFCSRADNNRVKQFKENLIRKHFFPSEEEANELKTIFPDPKKVLDSIYQPFVRVDEKFSPKLHVKQTLGNKIYKANLEFQWPTKTNVCGAHKDEDTSVQYAYLEACDFLRRLGLIEISSAGTQVNCNDHIIRILEGFASRQCYIGRDSSNYSIYNLLHSEQDNVVNWTSSIQVLWPVEFTVTSSSSSLDLAYYMSCLKSLMKLKAYGYLDNSNNLNKGILLALEKYDHVGHLFKARDISNPDYEIYVDASGVGIGAYLLSNNDEKIRWLSDSWRQDMTKFSPVNDMQLAEFYALVTAVFTWKHKFVGKKVMCYSDNHGVVQVINHGYYKSKITRNPKSFAKLFMLLIDVCSKNDITFIAQHVPRLNNVAADLLSRCNVDEFKRMVPTAFKSPKKVKKLWFCTCNESKPDDSDNKTNKP